MLNISKVGAIKYGETVDHLCYDGENKSYGIFQKKDCFEIGVHYKNTDECNDYYTCSSLGVAFETIEALEKGETI